MRLRFAARVRTAAAFIAASLVAVATPGAAAGPGTAATSCVACHTDAEKLKVEAAKVPVPAGSALQAGKG